MTTIERPFQLSDQADAARFWFLDLIHNPRALPPLSADLFCLNSAFSPIGLDSRVVNGYVYNSPRINRLFTEDYLMYLDASRFKVDVVNGTYATKVPDQVAADLGRLHPGRKLFANNGLVLALTRPA